MADVARFETEFSHTCMASHVSAIPADALKAHKFWGVSGSTSMMWTDNVICNGGALFVFIAG